MALTHALSTNNYGTAHLIVATSAANGTHTTLATALADAVTGDTVFLRDSVTENVTLVAGINISAWSGGSLNTPSISGTITCSSAGTSTISGIELITNSAPFLTVSGSAASIVNLRDCYLNASNNTGISHTSSNAASVINVTNCSGNIGTTGITMHVSTSAGNIIYVSSNLSNTGASVTPSSVSTGAVSVNNSSFGFNLSTSSVGILTTCNSYIDNSSNNSTVITTAGTGGANLFNSVYLSGTASCISIGAGTTVNISEITANSTNTNPITGAGTIVLGSVTMPSTGHVINTTTQTLRFFQAGEYIGRTVSTAPSAGMIGEQIRAVIASGSATALTTNTPLSITSISLTPGIWDLSGIVGFVSNAATSTTQTQMSLSQTNNTIISSTYGDQSIANTFPALLADQVTITIPSYRVSLSATTIYYLVVQATFTLNTLSAYGRISATRVS